MYIASERTRSNIQLKANFLHVFLLACMIKEGGVVFVQLCLQQAVRIINMFFSYRYFSFVHRVWDAIKSRTVHVLLQHIFSILLIY